MLYRSPDFFGSKSCFAALRSQCPAAYQSSLRQFHCRYRLRQRSFSYFFAKQPLPEVNDTTLANKTIWLGKFNCQIFVDVQSVYSVLSVSLLTY
jgi:hypothetical protein